MNTVIITALKSSTSYRSSEKDEDPKLSLTGKVLKGLPLTAPQVPSSTSRDLADSPSGPISHRQGPCFHIALRGPADPHRCRAPKSSKTPRLVTDDSTLYTVGAQQTFVE